MAHRFFKHMEPPLARLHNLLAGRLEGLSFAAGGRKWRFAETPPPGREYGVVIYGLWGGEEFTLWLNAAEWRVAAAAALGVEPERLESLPEPVLRAALELTAGEALDALGKASGMSASLRRLALENAAPPWPAPTFALERDDGLRLGGAWIAPGRNPAWLDSLEKAFGKRLKRQCSPPDDWEIPASLRVGKTWTMPARLLDDLEPGDVALPPIGEPEEWRTVAVHFPPGLLVLAERLDGRFATRGPLMSVRNNPPAEGSVPAASPIAGSGAAAAPVPGVGTAAAPIPGRGTASAIPGDEAAGEKDGIGMTAVDEVTVELHIETARAAFTLGQIRRLAAGQVVEFAAPVEGPARLCAGAKTVAEGDLVEVGGRVGFRIARLFAAPGKNA